MPLLSPRAQAVEARELQRELERKQVLLRQVESGDALDPVEPLPDGVRMDVEGARARRAAIDVAEADDDALLVRDLLAGPTQTLGGGLLIGGDRRQRPHAVMPRVEERSRAGAAEARLDPG